MTPRKDGDLHACARSGEAEGRELIDATGLREPFLKKSAVLMSVASFGSR
jgi:hypothetical protein